MIRIRKSEDRGHFDHGWLDTYHTFSFGEYFDPEHVQFRSLRVINDDRVAPGVGFPEHPHRDMEIITWVLEGSLAHRDSLGNGSTIRPGDLQRMTAGTGIRHSEMNPSKSEPVHLLQIWILPERTGLAPGYEQKHFSEDERRDRLRLIASRDGRDGSVSASQDFSLYASILEPAATVKHALAPGRHAWLQVARGEITLNGQRLETGDGAAVSNEEAIEISATAPSEILLFDLA
jgi:redox-sensitive bicupin YhaK (pirin superfamily)